MNKIKEFSHTYFLTAGECNPENEMPLPLLMTRIIEIATMHANSWGIGYSKLIEDNLAWVLSRVTIEMTRYPKVNEEYTLTTWIEDYNKYFSQRNMEIQDKNGEVIGYVRTIWMVINLATRKFHDISQLEYLRGNISDRPCPIEPQSRLQPVTGGKTLDYTFKYIDCDVNRHVNTVRYLELLMNQFDLEKYDTQLVHRMEIAFMKETRFGDIAQVNIDDNNENDVRFSLSVNGINHCLARFIFIPRE